MIVKCNVTDCIYNDGDYCAAGTIEINEYNSRDGINNCDTYQSKERG